MRPEIQQGITGFLEDFLGSQQLGLHRPRPNARRKGQRVQSKQVLSQANRDPQDPATGVAYQRYAGRTLFHANPVRLTHVVAEILVVDGCFGNT